MPDLVGRWGRLSGGADGRLHAAASQEQLVSWDAHGRALEEVRTGVVERLRARRAEIEEVIFARVQSGVSGPAGSEDAGYVEGLRAAVAAVVDYGLTGIERAGESLEPIPSAAVAQAQRAARAGVGLDTVLRRYVAGYVALEDFVMQEADREDFVDQRTVLRGVLETSASLLDHLIPSITNAYTQEVQRIGGSPPGGNGVRVPDRRTASSDCVGPAAGGNGAVASHGQAAKLQRVRILQAMVEVVAMRGFAGTTVRLVTLRAGVSSRTFYECFDGLEDCFIAVLDSALEDSRALIAEAFEREDRWQDGVRAALASLLVFFDSEPLLTQVWFVEAMAAGSWALEQRERIVALLRSMIVERWSAPGDEQPEPLAVKGVMASVLGLIHTHLITKEPGPLIELLGPLMGLVTAPYLDMGGVQREIERGARLAREIQAGGPRSAMARATDRDSGLGAAQGATQGAALPTLLGNPRARRARECLLFLVEHPDSSNCEIAVGIGVTHQSQISKLLSCLVEERLVVKRSEGVGRRNAWRLTPRGGEVARALLEPLEPRLASRVSRI
jgi:AcrR family transcriptional regulator/DNA-binding transcriptional ArsR family regulator